MVSTASTTSAASFFASVLWILVARDVCATLISVGRSKVTGRLKVSKNLQQHVSL